MDLVTDGMNEIGRLVALAERCSAEGQMNLNKMLEAAIYAEIRRAGWKYRPQITAADIQPELKSALGALKQEAVAPELVAALEWGLKTLAEGRPWDLSIEEAPDVFVCRTCGHAALGAAPDHCPNCGAWPGRFRKFVAMFNGDNLEPTDPAAVLGLLAGNAQDLERLVADLSEDELAQKPANGGWSLREHIAHFYDTQEMLDGRVERMLKINDPELVALAVFEQATEADRHPPTAREILAEFLRKRKGSVGRLAALPPDQLWRTGRHPEFGRITILRQAAYLACHEQTHLLDIEGVREEVAGRQ